MIDLAFRGLEDADGVVDETWVNSIDVSMEFCSLSNATTSCGQDLFRLLIQKSCFPI